MKRANLWFVLIAILGCVLFICPEQASSGWFLLALLLALWRTR